MIVAKVGGSLYDEPRLGPALRAWVNEQPEPVLLVPGGGEFADVVRKWDRLHGLGDEPAHWLAVRSMDLAGAFLRQVLRTTTTASVLDVHAFFHENDLTPHTWGVTSDSLAAAAAVHLRASRLVLLKSVDIPAGTPWAVAAERGWVDEYLPAVVNKSSLSVTAVNFRRWAEIRFPAGGI